MLLSDTAPQLLKLGPKLQQFTEHRHLHARKHRTHLQTVLRKKHGADQTHTHNLCLSEDVWAQVLAIFQDMLGLFRRDVYLQGGGRGGVDEAGNDGGNLLLDGGFIAVGMTEVLYTVREGTDGT